MTFLETAQAAQSYRDRCEDRVAVVSSGERTVIVVADGAGGIGAGDVAAETVVREIASAVPNVHSADEWVQVLRQIDSLVTSGESTAIVVDVRPYGIAGASVGDSESWIISAEGITDLTENQVRKPLLGSGAAAPVAFTHARLNGLLIAATDGFFGYAKRIAVSRLLARSDFYSIPRACIEMVRLPSGDLWDDTAIVAARIKPRQRTRKRYTV